MGAAREAIGKTYDEHGLLGYTMFASLVLYMGILYFVPQNWWGKAMLISLGGIFLSFSFAGFLNRWYDNFQEIRADKDK